MCSGTSTLADIRAKNCAVAVAGQTHAVYLEEGEIHVGTGKLGRTELDNFFHVFNSDDNKLISWEEFLHHASLMMQDMRQRELQVEESKQHVPTREELKDHASKAVQQQLREKAKRERRHNRPSKDADEKPASRTSKSGRPGSSRSPGRGERSAAARPGMAAVAGPWLPVTAKPPEGSLA